MTYEIIWKPKVLRPKPVTGSKITILGCGTSSGVPLLACKCRTCTSKDPRNKRLRASVCVQVKDKVFLIDTSPDLHHQAMANKVFWVDAVLFTHPHADHMHGADDLRSFNFLMAKTIPCYGNSWSMSELKTKFSYIFKSTQIGGGKPLLELHVIKKDQAFKVQDIKIQPLELIHGKLPVLGYRINDIAYITDCSYIPDHTFKHLKNLEVLVLDCLRPAKHSTHLNIEESFLMAKKINAKRTYFTHMGHEIEYSTFAKQLPPRMKPAYDGLVIRLKN